MPLAAAAAESSSSSSSLSPSPTWTTHVDWEFDCDYRNDKRRRHLNVKQKLVVNLYIQTCIHTHTYIHTNIGTFMHMYAQRHIIYITLLYQLVRWERIGRPKVNEWMAGGSRSVCGERRTRHKNNGNPNNKKLEL